MKRKWLNPVAAVPGWKNEHDPHRSENRLNSRLSGIMHGCCEVHAHKEIGKGFGNSIRDKVSRHPASDGNGASHDATRRC